MLHPYIEYLEAVAASIPKLHLLIEVAQQLKIMKTTNMSKADAFGFVSFMHRYIKVRHAPTITAASGLQVLDPSIARENRSGNVESKKKDFILS